MPVKVRRKRRGERGKLFKIVESSSGRVVGSSDTMEKAEASVRARNAADREKRRRRGR